MSIIPYTSAVGSLMFTIICTHPNLVYVVSLVSRYVVDLGEKHWKVMKFILRYMVCTLDMGLVYAKCTLNESEVRVCWCILC